MKDPVFLDSAAFLRVWQRVTGEAGITAAPAQLRALQTEYFLRTGTLCVPPAACPRLSTAAADLRCAYLQELALSAQLGAAADAAPMPLRETLRTMAQQDARHAQCVRALLSRLIF